MHGSSSKTRQVVEQFVGAIIYNALFPIDHVSNHWVRPFMIATIVYWEQGVINNGPYDGSIPETWVMLNRVGAFIYNAHVPIDHVSHTIDSVPQSSATVYWDASVINNGPYNPILYVVGRLKIACLLTTR